MFDWHVQTSKNGEPLGRPSVFTSPEAAIDSANAALNANTADEVTVYHRLHSNQASLSLIEVIPTEEILQKAAHLEKQAQRASRDG